MKKFLKKVLVVGDVPNFIGYKMVCKLLDEGYKVKASKTYVHDMEEMSVGSLTQMDFLSSVNNVKGNRNFKEIEYIHTSEEKLKLVISGCDYVIYLCSVNYDCSSKINSNTNGVANTDKIKSVLKISRACGVHQFICGLIPILYHSKGDTELAADIPLNLSDISQELFLESADSEFIFTTLQPHLIPSKLTRWKQYLNLKTINNHKIYVSKVRHFSKIKNKLFFNSSLQSSNKKALVCEYQINNIVDISLVILEYSYLINNQKWLYRKINLFILEHYYFSRYLIDFIKNPRVPFWQRIKFVGRTIKRLIDVFIMMVLLHLWPQQVYRFSTKKMLPSKSERYSINDKSTIPFKLIEAKTNKIQRTKELNVVMRGSSFNISKLDEIKGPIYLVAFSAPIRTKKDVNYIENSLKTAYRFRQSGILVYHIEVNRIDENGETHPPDGYSSSSIYKKLLDDPGFKRITVAENIGQPFKLPLSSSRIPIGAGLKVICALSYFADKINVYGWDFYLDSSPEYMSTWEAFLNLYKIKLDIYRSKTHFECAIINYYYGYHLSRLPKINNYGYLSKLDRHEKLIKKIERVLFN